jgi:hypothetical protein
MNPLSLVATFLLKHLGRFGYTTLLVLLAVVFVVDLFIPDPLPFVEEILLGLMAVTMAKVRGRKDEGAGQEKTPELEDAGVSESNRE